MTDAVKSKEKGNAAFRKGDWYEAIGHYSAAIFADRSNATYPLNRAAAYLKLGKNEDAERDCSTTLTLDPKNVKALYRRAQAREALRKLAEAQLDLAEAFRLDPSNVTVKKDLDRLRETNKAGPSSSPVSTAAAAPSANKITPRRKRIPITIVEPDAFTPSTSAAVTVSPPSSSKSKPASANSTSSTAAPSSPLAASSRPSNDLLTPVTTRVLAPSSPSPAQSTPAPAQSSSLSSTRSTASASASSSGPASARRPNGGIFRAKTDATEASSDSLPTPAPTPRPSTPAQATTRKPSPKNMFEFQREWDASSGDEEKWHLLKSIPPSSVKSLFGTSLTPALLLSIVSIISSALSSPPASSSTPAETEAAARTFITALSTVERFGMLVMFLSKEDKEKAGTLLGRVGIAKGAWGL